MNEAHGQLTIRPDDHKPGQRLTGPVIQIDATRRMLPLLERKAAQTRAAATAWLLAGRLQQGHGIGAVLGRPARR